MNIPLEDSRAARHNSYKFDISYDRVYGQLWVSALYKRIIVVTTLVDIFRTSRNACFGSVNYASAQGTVITVTL